MSRWFRMYSDALDDPKVQRLPGDLFKAMFLDAARGGNNILSGRVHPFHGRLSARKWRAVALTVFERDGFACRYCGESSGKLECDHVLPVSRGGSNEVENLVTSCRRCNRKKLARTADEMGWGLA